MKHTPTKASGVTVIDLEPQREHRGFSSRSFRSREFASRGFTFVAHGYRTLIDNPDVGYRVSGQRAPSEQEFHWTAPEFGSVWPLPVPLIAERVASSRPSSFTPIESAAPCLTR